jgi:hypothetical protein
LWESNFLVAYRHWSWLSRVAVDIGWSDIAGGAILRKYPRSTVKLPMDFKKETGLVFLCPKKLSRGINLFDPCASQCIMDKWFSMLAIRLGEENVFCFCQFF